jgi:hypothetical protein
MLPLSKSQLTRHLRRHIGVELYDESAQLPLGTAIYSLSDPRDLRAVRYIGQAQIPRRRFQQHLAAARLWLPDERPWWIKSPKLRPLYHWIRALYLDEQRLPTMIVSEWTTSTIAARLAERARIYEALSQRRSLFNVETEILGSQWPLV